MTKLYTCSAVQELMNKYMDENGICYTLQEGCLGYGTVVCWAEGYKTAIVTEEYLNEWSSGHKVRFYNECPTKYAKAVYDKFGDVLPGFYPENIDGMRKYLTDKLMK